MELSLSQLEFLDEILGANYDILTGYNNYLYSEKLNRTLNKIKEIRLEVRKEVISKSEGEYETGI